MDPIERTSALCRELGYRIIHGDTDALKELYSSTCTEHPAIIKTVNMLQGYLTSVEITDDTQNIYDTEFLYYWGMLCLGEQSPLVEKNLETAKTCFQKIRSPVPQVEARLAYIDLLLSDEPLKSEHHIHWLDILRQYANKQRDLFSMIVLAKICFQGYLNTCWENGSDPIEAGLPLKVANLLAWPCQMCHPVAIRFWNDMCSHLCHPESMWSSDCLNLSVLYDFKTSANMQIRP